AALWQDALLAQLRLAEIDGERGPVSQVLIRRALAALPQRDVGVIIHHRAAARADLGEAVGQNASNQAHIRRKGGVDMLMRNLRDGRHGFYPSIGIYKGCSMFTDDAATSSALLALF